jgi:hypothetical protein
MIDQQVIKVELKAAQWMKATQQMILNSSKTILKKAPRRAK